MKLERTFATSAPPADIAVRIKPDGLYIDVVAVTLYDEAQTAEDGSVTHIIRQAFDPAPTPAEYGPIVEAVIALRYTTGEEIALRAKPDTDPDKQTYLAFVQAAKSAAKTVLKLEG